MSVMFNVGLLENAARNYLTDLLIDGLDHNAEEAYHDFLSAMRRAWDRVLNDDTLIVKRSATTKKTWLKLKLDLVE
jgi:hypothetical protein